MNTKYYRSCKWLIEKLKNKDNMTFEDINKEWLKESNLSDGMEMGRKTFYNYRKTLKESFGIEVACKNGGNYAYYLKNPEILMNESLAEWMLNTLAIDENLMGCKSLVRRIILEDIPSGGDKLIKITEAMQNNYKLRFEYIRYGSPEKKEHKAEPWGLVLYRQRWYILASFGSNKKYTFGLDRMINPEITTEAFEVDQNFNAGAYFEEFYGIYNSGRDITRIIIRAYGDEAFYLRDLPIHKSQREIGSGDGYTDFMIKLRPNKELIAYLLSRRERLKVLSPDCIIDDMKAAITAMMANYS